MPVSFVLFMYFNMLICMHLCWVRTEVTFSDGNYLFLLNKEHTKCYYISLANQTVIAFSSLQQDSLFTSAELQRHL